MAKAKQLGQTVWLIKTTRGFLDTCLYESSGAMAPYRNYFWSTEKGARGAFATIERRFPRLGPTYELWEGTIQGYTHSPRWLFAVPTQLIDTKTV